MNRNLPAMTEITFATNFLTILDSRPIKVPADHVEDLKNYPAQGAVREALLPAAAAHGVYSPCAESVSG